MYLHPFTKSSIFLKAHFVEIFNILQSCYDSDEGLLEKFASLKCFQAQRVTFCYKVCLFRNMKIKTTNTPHKEIQKHKISEEWICTWTVHTQAKNHLLVAGREGENGASERH